MEFIETPAFTLRVSEYLDDEGYGELQNELSRNPERGHLIPGTGGLRKLRWADPRRGKGRRGGLRVIYFYLMSDQQIWLMTMYDKNEAKDLTPAQKKIFKHAIKAELDARMAKRKRRQY